MSPAVLPGLWPLPPVASVGTYWEQGISIVSTRDAAGGTNTTIVDGGGDHHIMTNVVIVMECRLF